MKTRILTSSLAAVCIASLGVASSQSQGPSVVTQHLRTLLVDPSSLGVGDAGVYPTPARGPYAYSTFLPGSPGFPAPGESYIDPVFGMRITRVTDHYPGQTFGIVPYARNGFADAKGRKVFSEVGIYNVMSGEVVNDTAPAFWSFRQSFDPIDPAVYYYHAGPRLMRFELGSNQATVIRDFGVQLNPLGGSVDWIDRSGRYMALNLSGAIYVYDKQEDNLFAGTIPGSLVGSGWVGISPDARWLVAAGNFEHRAFSIDLDAETLDPVGHVFWTLCGDHGDLVSASDGKTYMVTSECWDFPDIYAVDVSLVQSGGSAPARQQQRDDNTLLFGVTWQDDIHVSGVPRGPLRDWAFVSTELVGSSANDPDGPWHPYKNEIVMTNVLTGEVRRLAHHRSDINGYCSQPRVQAAWDGSGAFYVSNYADDSVGGCGYSDLYHISVYESGPVTPSGGR